MPKAEGYAAKLISDANDLISKIQGDLDDAQDFYESIDVNPDKVPGVLQSMLGPKESAELAQLVADDQQAIAQEVAEEAARLSFAAAPVATVRKKPRFMI